MESDRVWGCWVWVTLGEKNEVGGWRQKDPGKEMGKGSQYDVFREQF